MLMTREDKRNLRWKGGLVLLTVFISMTRHDPSTAGILLTIVACSIFVLMVAVMEPPKEE